MGTLSVCSTHYNLLFSAFLVDKRTGLSAIRIDPRVPRHPCLPWARRHQRHRLTVELTLETLAEGSVQALPAEGVCLLILQNIFPSTVVSVAVGLVEVRGRGVCWL